MRIHSVMRGARTPRRPFLAVPATLGLLGVLATMGASATAAVTGSGPGAPALTGTWKRLPAAPVSKLPAAMAAVWTGHQMIIHGAYPSVTFAYRPATGTWVKLRPGPKALTIEASDIAVWTGSRMLVMGLTNGSYNPAANTWSPIARTIMPDEAAVVGWTGRIVIIWGGVCCAGSSDEGSAYRPSANSWQVLPVAPLRPRSSAAGAWTGRELIVAGGVSRAPGGLHAFGDAAAYNPLSRTWRKLAPMPISRWGAAGLWDGHELLVIGGWAGAGTTVRLTTRGLAYNPATNRWRWLPAMPHPRSGFAAVWTGHQVLVWGGLTAARIPPPHGEAYDPATNRWTDLPQAPLAGRGYPVAVWTGRRMIVWGGQTDTRAFTDGAAFTPSS
jgi:hypothetical protein